MIIATPELDVPIPASLTPQEAQSLHAKAQAAFNTVEFLEAMGMPVEPPTGADKKEARALFFESPGADREVQTSGKALMLKALLDEYDVEVVRNATQLRGYIKLKLLELTEVGKESTQLKALELLGKLSEVQAFSEHLEISVTHRTTEELQQTLAHKLSAYLQDVVDVESRVLGLGNLEGAEGADRFEETLIHRAPAVQVIDLDDELGFVGGEVEEVKDEEDEKEVDDE